MDDKLRAFERCITQLTNDQIQDLQERLDLEYRARTEAWMTKGPNSRQIIIRELTTDHLYNILNGLKAGRWRTMNRMAVNGWMTKLQPVLEYEYKRRGYEPYQKVESFEKKNKI